LRIDQPPCVEAADFRPSAAPKLLNINALSGELAFANLLAKPAAVPFAKFLIGLDTGAEM
jgi:hypothetical protein